MASAGPVRGAAAAGVRDRLPDARQRERGGGRRPGGPPAAPPHPRGGRAGRVVAGVRLDRGDPARNRPAAFRAGPARDLPGEWLPEPLVAAEEGDPAWEAELADSLSFLSQSLSPSPPPPHYPPPPRKTGPRSSPPPHTPHPPPPPPSLDIAEGRIQAISWVANPDKLGHCRAARRRACLPATPLGGQLVLDEVAAEPLSPPE